MGILDKTKYYRREIGEVNFKPEELHVIAIVLEIPLEKFLKRSFDKVNMLCDRRLKITNSRCLSKQND